MHEPVPNALKSFAMLLAAFNPALHPPGHQVHLPEGRTTSIPAPGTQPFHIRTSPRLHRVLQVVGQAAAKLERVPPAPPAAPPSGGGGGGGGGDEPWMRLLDPFEEVLVLEDWMSKTRVYRMAYGGYGNAEFAQAHSTALEKLEALQAYMSSESNGRSPRMLFGLFTPEQKILALVGTEANPNSGLVCLFLSVRPSELNKKESKVKRTLLVGLHILAEKLSLPLNRASIFGCW
mmetsp:Transcript_143177/g.249702  ORF Transcript_143177/g.249702 Transcript_143177/m.249702 type:complete len:233 (-) Transcript_143177:114-812(-)